MCHVLMNNICFNLLLHWCVHPYISSQVILSALSNALPSMTEALQQSLLVDGQPFTTHSFHVPYIPYAPQKALVNILDVHRRWVECSLGVGEHTLIHSHWIKYSIPELQSRMRIWNMLSRLSLIWRAQVVMHNWYDYILFKNIDTFWHA